jgi:endo-1,4-beta-D-glucanase Y
MTSLSRILWAFALCGACVVLPARASSSAPTHPETCAPAWPAWEAFRTRFISNDGRVIDGSTARKHTVSEGQAYALFFSLVANDRKSFEQVLEWTQNNLAAGDLRNRLPAWQWGQRSDGSWGVIDANAASDADLWIIYALGEAGRLWGEPRFSTLAAQIAARVLKEETAEIPGLGLTMLPGPVGFQMNDKTWRLNPSYLPMQLMDWMANQGFDPAWSRIAESSLRLLIESAPNGYSPDWAVYEVGKGFRVDTTQNQPQPLALGGSTAPHQRGEGGYESIRVYLWAGMLNRDVPYRRTLLATLAPMARKVAQLGYPPEFVNVMTGETRGQGSSGFSAALLPFLSARGDSRALRAQTARITANPISPDAYYDQVLSLFATGWMEQRYTFAKTGEVRPAWQSNCAALSLAKSAAP